jgi:hypothetical protein
MTSEDSTRWIAPAMPVSSCVVLTETVLVDDGDEPGVVVDVDGYGRIVGAVHGLQGTATLCGIEDELLILKSPWDPAGSAACAACRRQTAPVDSPLMPSVSDRGDEASAWSDLDRVIEVITAAWDDGCPVASDPDATATAAIRRVSSIGRRYRGKGAPTREDRVEDLAKGLRDRSEEDPKLVGRLMADHRYLASKIIEALYPETTK